MSFDPFNYQKEMFKQMESGFSEMMHKMMREPSFMQTLSKNMGSMLDVEGMIRKHVDSVLKAYKIPTQEDLSLVLETVNRLESSLLDMEEALAEIKSSMANASSVKEEKTSELEQLKKDHSAMKKEISKIKNSLDKSIGKLKEAQKNSSKGSKEAAKRLEKLEKRLEKAGQ